MAPGEVAWDVDRYHLPSGEEVAREPAAKASAIA
jgi:hypothetical protein